ncbi:MAG TPA: flagellar assembly protein FliW [Blastocatellia bacterium]|nr:flagellar assembly protein FliW [Blastocatellia bacterium]
MPTIQLLGSEINYDESDIITFEEGLIGLPHLRQMVLISQPDFAPFLWLASVNGPEIAFIVMDPHGQFASYTPLIPAQIQVRLGLVNGEPPVLLTIARIASEWQQSTVNLRAPLVIAAGTMRGAQLVLTESTYPVNQPIAQ